MSTTMWFYVVMLIVFRVADHIAGSIAGSPQRPVLAWVVAAAWPVTVPFTLIASAAVFKRMKEEAGVGV